MPTGDTMPPQTPPPAGPWVAGRLVTWAAQQHGDRPSVVFKDQTYTHRDIETRSNRMAHALAGQGLQPGDRMAVLLENSVHSIDSVFGAEKAGLTYVALNARHTVAEHLAVLADAQASAVLVGPGFAGLADALLGGGQSALPQLRLVLACGGVNAPGAVDLDSLCATAPDTPPGVVITPAHITRISYTSGTTGQPKGVVPTVMSRLVDAIENGLVGDWSSLRRIHYGTAPTPLPLLRRALRVFGPILRQQYGMTEAVQPLCVLYPHEHVDLPSDPDNSPLASCGRPSAEVELVLRDEHGQAVPPGAVGEITLGHHGIGQVAFWQRPDLQTTSVRDGWFYTGDLGRLDPQGYLHIVGRTKDMVITGGFNVYAREVENAIEAHPAVLESAVLGLPDPEWGEVVAAAVVLRPGASTDATELQAFCARRIAGYKKPRRVAF